jgi:DivIVA domain-containing protein
VTPDEVRDARFTQSSFGRRGYDERSVDELLSRVQTHLQNPAADDLTVDDVRSAELPKSPIGVRGYSMAEVDAFLDRVVQEWPG